MPPPSQPLKHIGQTQSQSMVIQELQHGDFEVAGDYTMLGNFHPEEKVHLKLPQYIKLP